ncbi:MAG: hypothetical protein PVJ57_05205 [Phycisphaerae bacterium]|jgi:hypothetical protein
MLDRIHTRAGDGLMLTFPYVSGNDNVPATLEFWTAHVARDLLQLAVHFRALGILGEIPGGARYQGLDYGRGKDLPESAPPCFWLRPVDRQTRLNVLAECLRRLNAREVFTRIRETHDYRPQTLPGKWTAYLDRHAAIKGGLLTVVACCIDILVVEPGLEEIELRATWWQRWWAHTNE